MTTMEKNTTIRSAVRNSNKNTNIIRRADEIKKDYILLRNYDENIFPMRGILLKTTMKSIRGIEKNAFPLEYFSDKIKLTSMFQMDVISSIMIYIEDLFILSESFRRKIPYYKLLDMSDENQDEIGEIIGKFFKDVNSFSDKEFCRIFGYVEDLNTLDLENDEKILVKKIIQKNITELKRVYFQIKKFGKTHHPIFRRFKHAGSPLIPGAISTISKDPPLSEFESYTIVANGKDPLEDVIAIPLSKDVLEGYRIIIQDIQTCLADIVKNHKSCIERNVTGILPVNCYSLENFSLKDKEIYKKIISKFHNKHPFHMDDLKKFHYHTKIEKKELQWYLDLPDFLRECKTKTAKKSS